MRRRGRREERKEEELTLLRRTGLKDRRYREEGREKSGPSAAADGPYNGKRKARGRGEPLPYKGNRGPDPVGQRRRAWPPEGGRYG
jgi:hypothetical protein